MKSVPAISVIMAVYNGAEYLRESIDSILAQTFRDFEFLIIDDASDDETPVILEKYARTDLRIRVFSNDSNQWLAASLNRGLREAHGRYIARHDADDIALPDRFQRQVDFLENNPNIFLVGANNTIINENDAVNALWKRPTEPDTIGRLLPKKNIITHPSILFHNDGCHFYREKFRFAQDYDFYLRLLTEGKGLANLPEILVQYRKSNSARNINVLLQRFLFSRKAREFHRQRGATGKDDYNAFNPDTIFKVRAETSNHPHVLDWLIHRAFSRNECRITRQLIHRYWRANGFSIKYLAIYVGSILGGCGLNRLRKIKKVFISNPVSPLQPFSRPSLALFFTHGYGLHDWQTIGSFRRELTVYRKLSEQDCHLSLYTFDRTRNLPDIGFCAEVYSEWPYLFPRRLSVLYLLLMPFLRYQRGHEINVLITNQAHSGWSAILAGKIWHAKVIARCGRVRGEEAETLGFSGRRVRRKICLEKWTFAHADRCFIPTRELKDWVVKNYGIDPTKIDIVPNFVDTNQFHPDKRSEKDIDVLCLGRLADVKRHHLILEALKGLKAKVTFIGSGPLEAQLQETATANGVDLIIINRVPNEDLPDYFNKAKIYIIASKWEGHPKSLIEAMACGCACIGTRSPGIENQVRDEETGLLSDPTPASISECVKRLLEDEALRKTLGANARQYALAHFSLDKIFHHYKKTIANLTGAPSFPAEAQSEAARD